MKRIGLLGGMSWSATAVYYRLLNTGVQQRLGGHCSAEVLIHSFNFQTLLDQLGQPDRIEAALYDAALGLLRAGADTIALASLTGHRYINRFTRLPAPTITIGSSVSAALHRSAIRSVGVLATSASLRDAELMSTLIGTQQCRAIVPTDAQMKELDELIFGELVHMRLSSRDAKRLAAIGGGLVARGAQAILLGTTEFTFAAEELDVGVPTLDAAALHCRDLVTHCLTLPTR